MCGIHTSVSHVKAQRTWFHFTISIEVVVYIEMEPECLCVCIIDEGRCSDERNDDIYAFIFWVGGSRFLFVLLGDAVYVIAHLCSKCLQTWTLWLYSSFLPVTAGGTAYQDTWPHGLPCPSREGTQSCNFCLGFILGLDKSLFVWK